MRLNLFDEPFSKLDVFPTLALLSLISSFVIWVWHRPRTGRLPPGPQGAFLLGNLRKLRSCRDASHKWYASLTAEYGSLIHIPVLGSSIIVINSYQVLNDLFSKRAARYGDRPITTSLKLLRLDETVAVAPYPGDDWKIQRRLGDRFLNKGNIVPYEDRLYKANRRMIARMFNSPGKCTREARFTQVQIIVDMIYGIGVDSMEHPYVLDMEQLNPRLAKFMEPGASIIDLLPMLRYVPTWAPFSRWKRDLLSLADLREYIEGRPFNAVETDRDRGLAKASFTASLLEDGEVDRHQLKALAGSMYGAAVDTTSGLISRFILSMMQFPNVQRKLQKEMDSVVGASRLPDLKDRQQLKYLEAVVKEVFRYHIHTPLGSPRRAVEDDYYNGYLIPKGATVISNSWAMCRDPELYGPDPLDFRPERHLPSAEVPEIPLDPRLIAFGVGKRACIGRHLADTNIFFATALLVATSDVKAPIDSATGKEYMPSISFRGAVPTVLDEFPCRIVPRHEGILDLLRDLSGEDQ